MATARRFLKVSAGEDSRRRSSAVSNPTTKPTIFASLTLVEGSVDIMYGLISRLLSLLFFCFLHLFSFFLFGFTAAAAATVQPGVSIDKFYSVKEYWFDATIDHFNFRPTTVPTFRLRYLVNDDYYQTNATVEERGPVFFYAGNEADIFQFVNNSGFMFEAAEEFGAMVVFAEHRYYGLSNPFGNENALGKGYNVSFLSVEQAMQDFNTLSLHIREQWNMTKNTPFIVFGGSYGGNLALWLRLKHPNLWAGSIASSVTPLKHLLRETNGFYKIETEVYSNVSKECPDLIRKGWKDLYREVETEAGRDTIARALHLCDAPTSGAGLHRVIASSIHGWISNALETMVQYGYPYPTNFYNPVPGFPFKVACKLMIENQTGLGSLYAAASVYYNYTGQAGPCFEFESIFQESNRHWLRHGRHDVLLDQQRYQDKQHQSRRQLLGWHETDHAWGYQLCSEVVQPFPSNGITDFELPYTPNMTAYFEHCRKEWDVTPRPNWEEMYFFGSHIGTGSNIFITNGQLDPWRAAGITTLPKRANPSIVVRTIEKGAHHFDLRGSHPMDPPSVVQVRQEEIQHMKKWIIEWKELLETPQAII